MDVAGLIGLLKDSPPAKALTHGLRTGLKDMLAYGISGSARALYAASLVDSGYQVLIVTANSEEAKKINADLEAVFLPGRTAYFPAREIMPYEVYAHSNELQNQRLAVLKRLAIGELDCVVTPVGALSASIVPADILSKAMLHFENEHSLDLNSLSEQLVSRGFERVDRVENAAQFSIRGGIVDIYPVDEKPVRIELFGETIDSIRYFDPTTQRSQERLEKIVIPPAQELIITEERKKLGRQAIEAEFISVKQKLLAGKKHAAVERLSDKVQSALDKLEDGRWTAGLEQFHTFFYPDASTLIDYFRRSPVVIWNEISRIGEEAKRLNKERNDTYAQLLIDGALLPSQNNNYLRIEELYSQNCHCRIYMSLLPKGLPEEIKPRQVVNFEIHAAHSFLGKMDMLAADIKRWSQKKYRILLFTADQERAKRLQSHLWDMGIELELADKINLTPEAGKAVICWPGLQQGFQLLGEKLIVLTDVELYGVKRQSRKSFKKGKKTNILHDLKAGDYVVHESHGVGRYLGIEQLEVGGAFKDYLHLQYAGEDKLYLPTEQSSLIKPYVGAEDKVPKLNKLGGNEWARVKRRVKQSVEDLAGELLALYAARETAKGYALPSDSEWQKEFEEQFPYEETPDQLIAIDEVKADMEQPKPMDRLLVGDVGYGKTEVAMRAAFKVCEAGKQVAILVPTTVLAQQHYLNFQERFQRFPIKLAVLSRFTSRGEQKNIIEGLQRGEVDIVIGTHRLLSGDVRFKDIGLLIIDEEQRFGVKHKERLKELRHQVDALTLTATPIPRTLHMSLIGVRDMSVIETAPEERYPVQTYVVEHSPELVRDAIYREINRGGQVFYVFNRVRGLQKKAAEIQEMVPEASVGVGHGQLPERELEQVMLDFINAKYDVLVCTTIVENGLDIQNANTLLVDEADRMGLSQLYQLRGRVGRSNRVAYAYLTYRKDKVLNAVAEKRLSAIREFTELGSGFKIAMRDLEIRGAGNILGPEQHGHMLAVGFDLYCQLLEDAVKNLRGEIAPAADKPPLIELKVNAYISNEYITDSGEKIEFYRMLTLVNSLSAVENAVQSVTDRYGKPPAPVGNLLLLAKMRVLGIQLGLEAIKQVSEERVELLFNRGVDIGAEKLMELAQKFPRRLSISVVQGLKLQVRSKRLQDRELLVLLESILVEAKALVG